MLQGTYDKKDRNRHILIETHYLKRLDLAYISQDCFSLIIIKTGNLTAAINKQYCYFSAPVIICLDDKKHFEILSNNSSDVKIINFDPQFLNIYMNMSTMRSIQYNELCHQHAFFQLSPFLTENINEISFRVSDDTFDKVNKSFDYLSYNLSEQSDWYWSCRARSYFIDIINILERITHNYYMEYPEDSCLETAISDEFRRMISYINNHLEVRHTLSSLYEHFRINKNQIEKLFKEFLNTTFYDYLKQRRFEEACYYLRFTQLSGEQIAPRIGLSSSQNFCKFFHAVSGMTPNKYRKEMVNRRKTDPELVKIMNQNN